MTNDENDNELKGLGMFGGEAAWERLVRRREENRKRWLMLQEWDLAATRRAKERRWQRALEEEYWERVLEDADEGILFYDLDEDTWERRQAEGR